MWRKVAVLAVLATGAVCRGDGTDLKAGLEGEWRFASSDGKIVRDGSGRGFDGRVLGGSVGGEPRALVCDGCTAEVEIDGPNSAAISDAMTVLAWVRPSAVTTRSIFGKPHTTSGFTTPMPGLFFSSRGHLAFGAWSDKGKKKAICEGASVIGRDAWVMVGATFGGSSVALYVNGAQDGARASFPSMTVGPGPFYIGRTRAGTGMFKGRIGEVRLYRRALGAEEVEAFYRETRPAYPQEAPRAAPPGRTVTVAVRDNPAAPWFDYPTRTLALLDGYTPADGAVAFDAYGGWKGHAEKATGFFYPKKIGARWWLVDPEGSLFLHVGVVAVAPGGSATVRANFAKAFPSREAWAGRTLALLHTNGFNGAGAWSDVERLRSATPRVAYTVIKNFCADYARAKGLHRPSVGHSGFLHDSIPVFGEDFPAFCERQAQAFAQYRDDPWLLGYFSDNELLPPLLDNYLKFDASDPVQAANRRAALAWLAARKGKEQVSEADITTRDRAEFMGYAFETYFRAASAAIRKADPNHLYLGSRLHAREKENPWVLKAAGRYCDVIAINYYKVWGPDLDQMREWTEWSGRPVIITEWYAKGDDAGFPNTTGAGWIVKTQRDRGLYYQHYALGCLDAGNCVGWHWFKYLDNDVTDVKAEPSNRDSNKGIVSVDYTPYAPVLDLMRALNREVYPLTTFFDARSTR